ncbi:MAG: valine--pyruvate transaminase, partial [Pseudomonadota bacterium]
MEFSKFGDSFVGPTGIGSLMDDLGNAMAGSEPMLMLGGGNPGSIPEVEARLCHELGKTASDTREFARVAGAYDSPQGELRFIEALVKLLNDTYDWSLT